MQLNLPFVSSTASSSLLSLLYSLIPCRWVRQLVSDLNGSLVHFASQAQYESELSSNIMPMLDAKFEELDQGSATVLTQVDVVGF
jgi:hypothetical protein